MMVQREILKQIYCLSFSPDTDTSFANQLRTAVIEQCWGMDPLAPTFLRIAALIVCGLGVSAFRWSCSKFMPAFVKFGNQKYLALIPMSLLEIAEDEVVSLFLVKAGNRWSESLELPEDGNRHALVAIREDAESILLEMCLFPPDIILESS